MAIGQGAGAGKFASVRIIAVAPMVAMFLFAIIFFGALSDAGLFDPIVGMVVRLRGDDPAGVTLEIAALTSLVHLDGSGTTTFLIAVPALLPVYEHLGTDRR